GAGGPGAWRILQGHPPGNQHGRSEPADHPGNTGRNRGRRPGAIMTRTLAILLFDDVEVLDFCGPFEVFSVANRFTDPPGFRVLTVAEKAGSVLTRGGLIVEPHHRLPDCPSPDLILVPGGMGTRKEMHNAVVIDWVRQVAGKVELILSVCTGSLVLAK